MVVSRAQGGGCGEGGGCLPTLPAMAGGETSDKYSGTTTVASPAANPFSTLATINIHKLVPTLIITPPCAHAESPSAPRPCDGCDQVTPPTHRDDEPGANDSCALLARVVDDASCVECAEEPAGGEGCGDEAKVEG